MSIGNQMDLYREILADYAPPPPEDDRLRKEELREKLRKLDEDEKDRKLVKGDRDEKKKAWKAELKELVFPGHDIRNEESFAWYFERMIGEERARQLAERGDSADSGRERTAEYVRLRALILRYEEGNLSEEEYLRELRELTGAIPPDRTDVARLEFQDRWEKKLLGDMVSDFLNPIRRKLRMYEDGKRSAGSGYVDDVRLLSEFLLYRARQSGVMTEGAEEPGGVGRSIGGHSREDCERLFEVVRWNEEANGLFVPLRIYPETGLGVYLIGNYHLKRRASSEGYCRVCKLGFSFVTDCLGSVTPESGEERELDMAFDLEEFTSVRDALDALDREAMDPSRFKVYREFNPWSRGGIPDSFRRYFSLPDDAMREEDERAMEEQRKAEETYRQKEKDQRQASKVGKKPGQSLWKIPGMPGYRK